MSVGTPSSTIADEFRLGSTTSEPWNVAARDETTLHLAGFRQPCGVENAIAVSRDLKSVATPEAWPLRLAQSIDRRLGHFLARRSF